MSDQKQPPLGQRNAQVEGIGHIVVTGDHNKVKVYNSLPERSAKHHLRAPVGDFVGREAEIAKLLDALSGGGQASISGISGLGGIGKTELALVVAGRLRERYPDAQLLIEMRGTDPQPRLPEEALAECVRAFDGLEARLPGELDKLVKLYRDCLAGRRVLVVLDNAADANQVRPLLVPEGCALLVTSRETISLPKMARIRLEKLPPDKARELLLIIAPHAASVADQICSLCGYLPLALRAAASLLDVTPDLDPVDYANELRDERARLELKYANAEGHEISVEASFQLSYARLQPEAARVFRSLGNLGMAHKNLGDMRKAIEFYEQRLVIAREIGDRRSEGDALDNLGLAYGNLGDARKVIESYEQCLVIIREIGNRRGEGNVLGNLGVAHKYSGDARKAVKFYEQHLVIARETGDRLGEGNALFNTAMALEELGEREQAIAHAEAALKIFEEIESPRAAMVREQLAEWQGQAGDL